MNDTSKAYWIGVGKRLSGLAKKALSMSIPIAVSAGIDKACGAINCKLREIYKTSIVNALITLALNVAGLLCVLYCPLGIVPSRYLAAFLFIASLVWSCVRLVEYLRKYGKETLAVCKSVLAQRSVSRGIENYVCSCFPMIMLVYAGINVAANRFPPLRQIPSLNKTIKLFVRIFWKQILIYVIILLVYSVAVYWIAKPILLSSLAGVCWREVYFYPVRHLASFFKR